MQRDKLAAFRVRRLPYPRLANSADSALRAQAGQQQQQQQQSHEMTNLQGGAGGYAPGLAPQFDGTGNGTSDPMAQFWEQVSCSARLRASCTPCVQELFKLTIHGCGLCRLLQSETAFRPSARTSTESQTCTLARSTPLTTAQAAKMPPFWMTSSGRRAS